MRIFNDTGTSWDDKTSTYDGADYDLNRQIDVKPSFRSIEKVSAVFTDSDITYSELSVDYNSLLYEYAGADPRQNNVSPQIILENKPMKLEIYELK